MGRESHLFRAVLSRLFMGKQSRLVGYVQMDMVKGCLWEREMRTFAVCYVGTGELIAWGTLLVNHGTELVPGGELYGNY